MSDIARALGRYATLAADIDPAPLMGQVVRVVGLLVESNGPSASVGELKSPLVTAAV